MRASEKCCSRILCEWPIDLERQQLLCEKVCRDSGGTDH